MSNIPVKDRYGDQDEGNSSDSSDSDSDQSEVVKYALTFLSFCQLYTQVSMFNTVIYEFTGAGSKARQGFLQNAVTAKKERSKDLSERCQILH